MHRSRPSRLERARQSLRRIALLLACVTLPACDAAPAALEVGEARYSEEELGALTTSQRERLALLTGLGLAVADERVTELVRPFAERARADQLLRRLTLEEAARASGLGEPELRSAYLRSPELELTVRHLVVLAERWREDSVRAEARSRAADALERVRSGEDFATVAGAVSEEPGARRDGGRLPPGRRGSWVPEFWSAAASLDEGEVSDVVETRYGYHVLQLIERDTIPFDEVRYDALSRILQVAAALPAARQRLMTQPESVRIERALEMGIAADSSALERVRADRLTQVANLALTFGFGAGAEPEEVKAAAMRALADPRQSVRIALTRLEELGPALHAMFEIRSADPVAR